MTPKQIKEELKKYGLTDADLKDFSEAELQAKLDEVMLEQGGQAGGDFVIDGELDDDGTDGVTLQTSSDETGLSSDSGIPEPETHAIKVKCTLTCILKDTSKIDGKWYQTGASVRLVAEKLHSVGPKTRDYLKKQRVLK